MEQLSELILQVKRILVPQRENPIINRLNKTKVEKFPDLQMEREEKLKALRKKDQAARLARVSCFLVHFQSRANCLGRKRKRIKLFRSGRRRSGRRIMHMMRCSRGMIRRRRITRTGIQTILCSICCRELDP